MIGSGFRCDSCDAIVLEPTPSSFSLQPPRAVPVGWFSVIRQPVRTFTATSSWHFCSWECLARSAQARLRDEASA